MAKESSVFCLHLLWLVMEQVKPDSSYRCTAEEQEAVDPS